MKQMPLMVQRSARLSTTTPMRARARRWILSTGTGDGGGGGRGLHHPMQGAVLHEGSGEPFVRRKSARDVENPACFGRSPLRPVKPCPGAQHIPDALHVGGPVRVVDQDVLHHLSDVVNACECLVSASVVLVPS